MGKDQITLNGQKLLSISLRARGARTRFGFDLGGELETIPFDRTSEQWTLYEPTGKVLAASCGSMHLICSKRNSAKCRTLAEVNADA